MKKLKICFFGTSDRSSPILESLNNNFSLSLCVTKTDTKVGRGQEIRKTGVKLWCTKNNIPCVEVSSLKEYDLKIVMDKLQKIKPDYGVVADFSYIIPEEIISVFKGFLINIHFSLLPKYRGASPVQFAIMNGDDMTGITYQVLNKKLDAGEILSQVGYKMNQSETSKELYETLFEVAAGKLPDVILGHFTGSIKPISQDEEKATYTYSRTHPHHTHIFKEDGLINWKSDPVTIERKIRAFYPWPVCWTYLNELQGTNCLLYGKIKFREHVKKDLLVKIYKAHLDGNKIGIDKIQVEGKKIMSWEEFKNGFLL